MSKKTCKDCLHCSVENENEVYCSGMPWHYPFGGSDTTTLDKEACKYFLERDKPTIFHRITASPEVLAPKLVYRSFIRRKELRGNGLFLEWKPIKIKCYKSKVIPGVHYKNSTEAIAATAAKLKEVYNETTSH